MFSLSRIIILSLLCSKVLGQMVNYYNYDDDEIDFARVLASPIDSNTLVDFQNLYCTRLPNQGGKRFLNGSFTFKEDFDNSFSVTTFDMILRSGQFVQDLPISATESVYNFQLCEFMNGIYKNYMHPSIQNYSDFEINGDETSCIIKAGTYHINGAPGDPSSLPGPLHSGYHKLNLTFVKDDVSVGGFELLYEVTRDRDAK